MIINKVYNLSSIIKSLNYDSISERNVLLIDIDGNEVPRNSSMIRESLLKGLSVQTQDGVISIHIRAHNVFIFINNIGAQLFSDFSNRLCPSYSLEDNEDLDRAITDFLYIIDIYYQTLSIDFINEIDQSINSAANLL